MFINMKNNNIILRMCLSSLFLALSVAFSMLEIKVQLPSGAEFDLRLFDTIFLLLALATVKLNFSIFIGALQPWIHLAIDGDHSPISIAFYSVSNVLMVITFWLFCTKLFNIRNIKEETRKNKIFKILFGIIPFVLLAPIFESLAVIASGIIISNGSSFFSDFAILVDMFFILFGIYLGKIILTVIIYFALVSRLPQQILNKFEYQKEIAEEPKTSNE